MIRGDQRDDESSDRVRDPNLDQWVKLYLVLTKRGATFVNVVGTTAEEGTGEKEREGGSGNVCGQ